MSEKKSMDIRYIHGKYYNANGKHPNKALSNPYGKRLYNAQKKYGDQVSLSEARGHDNLSSKAESYKNLFTGKKVKTSAINLNDLNLKTKVGKLSKVDKGNLRTRFQYGFRILDAKGDTTINPHGSFATDGLINFKYYIGKIDDMCWEDNAFGGFHYVVYDKTTKDVVYDIEYNNEDID